MKQILPNTIYFSLLLLFFLFPQGSSIHHNLNRHHSRSKHRKIPPIHQIFLSLQSDSNSDDSKNETLTKEKVEEIMKDQNDILREEMKNSRSEIKEELNKTQEGLNAKLNESTTTINTFIKNNHKKIKNALKKLQNQIKENEKESDDVASILISKEIASIERKKQELGEEIEALEREMPDEVLNRLGNASNCSGLTSCHDCTQKLGCGWCDMYQICVEGDEYGPFLTTCKFYSFKTCSDNDCNNYNNCEDCINNPFCGWCKDVLNGVEGCLNENKEKPVCPYQGWIKLGTRQNLCEFTSKFKKSDFLSTDSQMSQEEKNLKILQVRASLEKKRAELATFSSKLEEMKGKMEQLRNHYSSKNLDELDMDDELEEFNIAENTITPLNQTSDANATRNNTLIDVKQQEEEDAQEINPESILQIEE